MVIFDGAMGTLIQRFKLNESPYRGERFIISGTPQPSRVRQFRPQNSHRLQ